jgi:hypothetical protein
LLFEFLLRVSELACFSRGEHVLREPQKIFAGKRADLYKKGVKRNAKKMLKMGSEGNLRGHAP